MSKILGYDDCVHVCDCCGKSDLKGTFAVEHNGDVVHYGSVCVTRHTGKAAKDVRQEARAAEEARRADQDKAYSIHPAVIALNMRQRAAHKAGLIGRAFKAFCAAEIEAAHAAYREIYA